MKSEELQKLRELPVEGVAERLGLNVKKHKSLCPFHNDHHASLSFKVSKNTFRCFVCGASGGPIDLVMKYLGKDFREATKWLADENNIILTEYKPQPSDLNQQTSFDASRYERFFEHPWLNDEARRFLFDERRLDPRVVRWCRLNNPALLRNNPGLSNLTIGTVPVVRLFLKIIAKMFGGFKFFFVPL